MDILHFACCQAGDPGHVSSFADAMVDRRDRAVMQRVYFILKIDVSLQLQSNEM